MAKKLKNKLYSVGKEKRISGSGPNGPFVYHVLCLSEFSNPHLDSDGVERYHRVRLVAEFGNADSPENIRAANLAKHSFQSAADFGEEL